MKCHAVIQFFISLVSYIILLAPIILSHICNVSLRQFFFLIVQFPGSSKIFSEMQTLVGVVCMLEVWLQS